MLPPTTIDSSKNCVATNNHSLRPKLTCMTQVKFFPNYRYFYWAVNSEWALAGVANWCQLDSDVITITKSAFNEYQCRICMGE